MENSRKKNVEKSRQKQTRNWEIVCQRIALFILFLWFGSTELELKGSFQQFNSKWECMAKAICLFRTNFDVYTVHFDCDSVKVNNEISWKSSSWLHIIVVQIVAYVNLELVRNVGLLFVCIQLLGNYAFWYSIHECMKTLPHKITGQKHS